MKITPRPTGIGELEINDALVFVDDFHREKLGLDFIFDRCTIADASAGFSAPSASQRIVLLETRLEILTSFIEWVSTLPEGTLELGFVYPKTCSEITEWLLQRQELQNYSIRDYVISDQAIYLDFGPQQPGDLDAHSVFTGVKFGMNISVAGLSEQPQKVDEVTELRTQLISVLESIDLLDTNPHSAKEIEESLLETEKPRQEEQKQKIAALEGRIVTLQTKLDALQRKYDALANSTLGKITLSRWNKKRDTK